MKGTSRAAKKSATKKKAIQGKRKKEDDLESDGDDGVPGGKLRKIQKQLFDTCLEGKAKFDTFSKSQTAPKSFKAMKSQAGDTIDAFHQNEHGNEKMAQFKKEEMNPIARKAKAAIKEYAQAQAAELEKDLLEEFHLDDYSLSGDEREDGAEGEDGKVSKEEEEKDYAEGGDAGEGNEITDDTKVDDNEGVDKSADDSSSSDGLSEGEVEGDGVNANWTSDVIKGSDNDGSS